MTRTKTNLVRYGTTISALVLLLFGGVMAWGTQQPAVADAHHRAILLFNAMETHSATTETSTDEITEYDGFSVVAAGHEVSGHFIVLKVTGTSDKRNNFDWWPSPSAEYVATRCFRWTEQCTWGTAEKVECPRARP